MSETNSANQPANPADRRKLVAIVYADMVGYSRLMGLDDIGTLERLRTLRRELIDPAIAEHGGRVVNTGGDSLLMVFDSVDGAVRCAVAMQQQVPARDGALPPERRIRFRIGINIGDAIPDGADIHGDVVNVAARLQAECPAGAICLSRGVRDHVRSRLDLTFEALGELSLKNIALPVEAFVLRPEAATPTSIELALVHGTGDALPPPDKPSIAVLAFTNMSGDPEQEYFSDGIADDIITELSRSRSLEGSVRRYGSRVRIAVQLIDATTGNHIWAERYDRSLEDVFAVQDEITMAAVAAIHPAVTDAEQRRALRKPPGSLDAWEAYQRGLWHMAKPNISNNELARRFFEHATVLDASFVAAYSALALAYNAAGATVGALPRDDALQMAAACARKAVETDPNDSDAQAVLAASMMSLGHADEASERIAVAVLGNGNSALVLAVQGAVHLFTGRPSEGRGALRRALQLNPRDPRNGSILTHVAISYYFERDYEAAITVAKDVLVRFPDHPFPHRWLAASLGQLGSVEAAKEELHKAQEAPGGVFRLYTRSRPPWFRPEDFEHMLDGLRKAGWQS